MRFSIRSVVVVVLALLAVFAVAGCGSDDSDNGSSSDGGVKKVTVGFDNPLGFTNNIGILTAQDQGFFKKHGLQVKTVNFNGGSDATKALAGGSIDVQGGVGFDAVGAQAKSIDAKVFYGVAQDSDFAFFANPDTGVSSFEDLEGKKVAISTFGSYTDFLTKQIVAAKNLPAGSITEVPLGPNPAIIGSVTKGTTSGTWDPSALAGLFKGKAKNIGTVSDLGIPSQYSSLLAMNDYIDKNKETLTAFADAMKEATAWIKAHKAETIALAIKVMKLPKPVATAFYDASEPILTPDGAINVAGLEAMAKAVPSLKLGPSAPPVADTYTDAIVGAQ